MNPRSASWLPRALGLGAVIVLFSYAIARADTAPTPLPPAGFDWALALGAIGAALGAISMFLHWLAPRTKTTIDDKFRDDVDEVLAFARNFPGVQPSQVSTPTFTAAPARDPQSGKTRIGTMALLALVALVVACTAAQFKSTATTAEHELVNCTAQQLGTTPALDTATLVAVVNLVVVERAKCSPTGSLHWTCVEHDLEAEGKTLGGCAFVKLLAGSPAPPPASTPGVAARMADEDPGRSALERFRAKVAGSAMFHTAAGDY